MQAECHVNAARQLSVLELMHLEEDHGSLHCTVPFTHLQSHVEHTNTTFQFDSAIRLHAHTVKN